MLSSTIILKATSSESIAADNGDETIADYLSKHFKKTNQTSATLREIKNVIAQSDWKSWWDYHKKNWEDYGWSETIESELNILIEDIPYLFSNEGVNMTAADYQKITNFHLFHKNKVNEDGTFLPFSGCSLVAMLDYSPRSKWRTLHAQLKLIPEIQQYFALLPVNSWHITLATVDNLEPRPAKTAANAAWKDFCDLPMAFKIKKVYTHSIILLGIELETDNSVTLKKICASLDIPLTSSLNLHISLGYQYRPLPVKVGDELKAKINALLCKLNLYSKTQATLPPKFYQYSTLAEWTPLKTLPEPSRAKRKLFYS